MPRYYLDIREGGGFAEDEDGIELEDIAQAQMEAAHYLQTYPRNLPRTIPAHWDMSYPLRLEIRVVPCLR